jgi:hypothetical protein
MKRGIVKAVKGPMIAKTLLTYRLSYFLVIKIQVMVMQTYKYMHRRADKSLVLRESGPTTPVSLPFAFDFSAFFVHA